jgi:oligopeptide/dipeptide ABC transporter ATP-binding protein
MKVNGQRDACLSVVDLTIEVHRPDGWLPAVRNVSFDLATGERIAVVGESGSGKSLTALSLGCLLPPGARVRSGEVRLDGHNLYVAQPREVREARGRTIAFVFQNPMSSLDPLLRVGRQIEETMEAHALGTHRTRRARAIELLERVGVRDAARRVRDYPHQFSGGMRQRVMIASALAANPKILVADEPTTALDVTVQAEILELLRSLSNELDLGLILITHDLAVARQIADRVIVMYAGRVLETGPSRAIIEQPDHPYSQALLRLVPDLEQATAVPEPIPGAPLAGWEAGDACPFVSRCLYAEARCTELPWQLAQLSPTRRSACVVPALDRVRRDTPQVVA